MDPHIHIPADRASDAQTLVSAFDRASAEHARGTALVDGAVRLSYADLNHKSRAMARGLLNHGIMPGDSLLVHLPNSWELVVVVLACMRAGVVPTMMLHAHREHELTRIADHVDARGIVISGEADEFVGLARQVTENCASVEQIFISGCDNVPPGCIGLENLMTSDPGAPFYTSVLTDDVLFLLSGGTTGLPKVVARKHSDYLYGVVSSSLVTDISSDTVYLVSLPASHTFPLGCPGIFGTLLVGGRVVMIRSPRPEIAFEAMACEGVTHTAAVPAVVGRWLETYDPARWDLSALHVLQVGGSRLSANHARRAESTFGCAVQQVYGMSEGMLNSTRLNDPEDVVLETQGRPVDSAQQMKIVDSAGRDLPFGSTGELLVRGPGVFSGYYRAPDHNSEAFTSDGWFRTGDLVRMHPSGNLVVEGRVKDLINRGGEKISAEELEDLLNEMPEIRRVAVVAAPHSSLGEQVCTCIVLRAGCVVTLQEIRLFLSGLGVAQYKLPSRLEILDDLPQTSIGKINKAALRSLVADKTLTPAPAPAS
ncbi:(2,3-dihydroxybenzoyl)adenylate synthase [Streptomyces sp. NPDC048419]|uniref:(2,3-dihydroxybenzoyl)adenylate synthase n=1 Tax=Streptomyces sp. NPDC048419 TaxID=3365547 RepID=UPI00371CC0E7